ncbi:glycosyltransferase family 4 protein [Synechococcus sp. UW140]|uniref:glycosyltransferase family 4 protein n=1 Tax=Synechococcus sp. UW140 TaxID=368503 RepID=UPI003137CB7E
MTSRKFKASIFAPLPPQPPGGIGSIVSMLQGGFEDRYDLGFFSPIPKKDRFSAFFYRPIGNLVRLFLAILNTEKGGKFLLFSSEGVSFFEKAFWSILIIAFGRKPSVVMVSGLFPSFWEKLNFLSRRLSSLLVSNKNFTLVVQSENWKKYYLKIFPQASIEIAHATAAQEFYCRNRPSDLSVHSPQLVYVGWIIPEKGIYDLLDAMMILIRRYPDLILRLIGPTFGKQATWNNAVYARKITDNVRFLEAIYDRKLLINELDADSIFVFPSHYEGFPVALLEAITLGLPCVASSVGGIPDILDNGKAGLLVEPMAPFQLASSLSKIIDDRILRELVAMNAWERAREIYNYTNFIKSYQDILRLK